mmetsp:Transcript_11580/g.27774  ORF Transcript_11580/g.27774 Transcript_11580/m.27774 type:complete len:117 (-) Transcript_11580:227-577(-)|eukprot:3844326-Rhodomonas_salina.4
MSAGQMAAKEASKAAQREKEEAAHAKKLAIKDRIWAEGAKDTSKTEAELAKTAEAEARKAERKALEAAEGSLSEGGGAPNMKRCKECKKQYDANSKKGCQNCVQLMFAQMKAKKKK